ncbi:hypothetical protein G4G27_15045 [Sphingomonas sp. So64.6b]|uniref:hypothetical protein n=1 Tax=Sphingomonas sp. So64.6b TaxID=2997354 RepID=UPI00160189E7|nr:hypothetical protein [Sphingomonas sp. So64.6b]QNA85167.1 hypothetical protein G4G27_15045 [Sphingomonas sp. So64.6b]
MLRPIIAGMALLFFPGAVAQDVPSAPANPPAPAAGSAPAAPVTGSAMCGGDGAVPKIPTLLPGYGGGGFVVRTMVPEAQAFFDNGMQLGQAFAHKASIAAFAEAVRLDPNCAMCRWGEAWASGPTINYPIDAAAMVKLEAKVLTAERLAASGPAKERELLAALRLRYVRGGGKGPGDLAFARAMDVLAERYPDDDAIATLTADAWMILTAHSDRMRYMPRSVVLLERVLKRHPDYTPAIHFYIHATEISGFPKRAEPYADRLAALAPAASHLVHMPSHTYYWIGRYQDAADTNMRAVEIGMANAKRLGMTMPDGVWQLPYHPHNVQFGVGSALISGDAKTALALSDPLVRIAAGRADGSAYAQIVAGTGYFAQARFADPKIVLALPEPKLPYMKAYWHYARGEAYARLGDVKRVLAEAAAIKPIAAPGNNSPAMAASRMAAIARAVLVGRAAMLDHQPKAALKAFGVASKLQESKIMAGFADPPAWWYPVRRDMAAALLAMGKPAEAIRMADAALAGRPRDPVTLSVRAEAEAAIGSARSAGLDRRAALAGWRGDRAMLGGFGAAR